MDEKKVQAITDILSADPVFAVKVIELNPEDAAKEFAAKGLPVSEDDLTAYGRLIDEAKALSQTVGELEESSLEKVAGGASLVGTAVRLILPVVPRLPFTPLPIWPVKK